MAEVTGITITLTAASLFAFTVYAPAGFAVTIICIAVFLFLLGMFNPNVGALAITSVQEKIGMASALMGFIQMGLSAISAAIVSSMTGLSSITMSAVLLACTGIAVISVFAVRLAGAEAVELEPKLIRPTI